MGYLYPLKLEPYFKEFIWGSRKLETLFGKRLPPGKAIGESWEVFDQNVIRNSPLAGQTLADVTRKFDQQLVGTRIGQDARFPLLLKLSATELDLSIQVHPNDAQAQDMEPDSGFSGKTEAIYILDAEPGSRVFYGFNRAIDRDTLQAHLAEGTAIVDLLQAVTVEPGDVIFVPPGTVHGYGAGLVYFELQRTSDITYRLFDWHRVDATGKSRPLHIAQALEVMDYEAVNPHKIQPLCIKEDYGQHCFLVACRHFVVERLDLSAALSVRHSGDSFHALCAIDGSATLYSSSGIEAELRLGLGETVLLPALIKEYRIAPGPACQILRSYVPDLKRDVVDHLLAREVPARSIARLGGSMPARNDVIPLL